MTKSLDGVSSDEKPHVTLSDEDTLSFLSSSFVFGSKESKAGETCRSQLRITSNAFSDSAPVVLDSLTLNFEGSLRPIKIKHAPGEGGPARGLWRSQVEVQETFEDGTEDDLPSEVTGQADLTIRPGQTRTLEVDIPLRAAGDVQATSVLFHYRHESFSLDYSMKLGGEGEAKGWYIEESSRPRRVREAAHQLHVLPRPPKMEVKIKEAADQYYANELLELKLELLNAEDETAQVKLDVYVLGKEIPPFQVQSSDQTKSVEGASGEARCSGLSLGTITSQAAHEAIVLIDPVDAPTTLDLQIRVSYHLDSDPATPIIQSLSVQLNVVNAFEANYDLVPRIHDDVWPSLFDSDGLDGSEDNELAAVPRGMAQKWHLICHYASFAEEALEIVGMDMKILSSVASMHCEVTQRPQVPDDGIIMGPKTMHEAQFELVVQKTKLDDRQPVTVDLGFIIQWRRDNKRDSQVNTTIMQVGKYLVLSTEPRVLASVFHAPLETTGLLHLEVTVENPSNHFLTFGLSMEPSDEFAFSGAKQTTVHLLPLSRRKVTYRLLPLVGGKYVKPGLVVRDKYFQKVLRVIPTEGMKIDKDGLLLWVPGSVVAEEDEPEDEAVEA